MGRRAVFLLLAILLMSGALAWAFAPDLKSLRPDIETFLKHEFQLQELTLGEFSWYWAGHLGVKSAASSFVTRDGSFAVRGSSITVTISTLELIFGKISPIGVCFRSGDVQLALDGEGQPGRVLPPVSVTLKDMDFHWRYGGFSGQLEHFTLSYDSDDHDLMLQVPGGRMRLQLDESMLPAYAEATFSNLRWLPVQWQKCFEGVLAGNITLDRPSPQLWAMNIELAADEMAAVTWPESYFSLPLSSFKGRVKLEVDAGFSAIEEIGLDIMEWKAGRSTVYSTARWRRGTITLTASSPYLEMPYVWGALKPLGDASWQAWLTSMQHGVASEAGADLEMKWLTPWLAAPTDQELASLTYHVNAHVRGMDIALGFNEDAMVDTDGDIELDHHGLKAMVISTRLPHHIGMARGSLRIPWKTLLIDVSGSGDIDAGKLHAWLDADGAAKLAWKTAPAEAAFSIRWMPEEAIPRQADISLRPRSAWELSLQGVPVQVTSGMVEWGWNRGVRLDGLVWSTPHLDIKTDMVATTTKADEWEIVSMQASAEGDLARLSAYFLLPIESSGGLLRTSLVFDGAWHGEIDLKDAYWSNLLGTKKDAGRPLMIHYGGRQGKKAGVAAVLLEDIRCDDRLLRLAGDGSISASGLSLNLHRVETASFTGAIDIRAPFGPEPWELGVDAAYLNRNALPASLSRDSTLHEKPWALHAKLDRFVWDDAEIRGVSIKLASALNSVAVLKAASLRSGGLVMNDLSTLFSMPGGGVVDVRSFEAELGGLQLKLSATLTPESGQGVDWRGFATLHGNFGDMMRRAELSNVFEDGDVHLLFSGQGEFFSEQPWWQGMDGRLRMRVDDGRILKGGTLSKLLAATSLADLPALLLGDRDDLTKPGLGYKRLQMEAFMHGEDVQIHNLAIRSSAMDIAGKGRMDMDSFHIDLTLVMRPLQNLDALLSRIPIVRDIFGGAAHSFIRRVYRMHGPIADAEVERILPEEAGLAAPGLVEMLLDLPERWFGNEADATRR